ncbi:MAG: carbohydrate-binding protein [Opitutaceae bacterium]|nr:carbohydrate-binding protein [Cytophagales bacterium]
MKIKLTNVFSLIISKGTTFSLLTSLFLFSFSAISQTTTVSVPGQTNPRTIFVYAPSSIPQNRPLVISMHGLNQDINYQKGQAKWELVADTAKIVVVYPAGEGNSWDINGTKDTDFILAIIESMVTRFGIDRNKVYVSGFSMGGMMCYNVANKIANKVAAIGPVSGYLFGNTVASSRPMPIIHVHGTADDVVHYEPFNNQQGVVAMLQKWRTWNQCPATGTRTTPYPVNKPTSKSVREYWGPCKNSEVELISLDGKGHWHSNDAAGVITTYELWRFFRRHSLGSSIVLPTVSLSAPANNATYTIPASITLSATATKTGGSISKVEFYNGTTKLGEDISSPYSYSWTNVAKGSYTITAVATDNVGGKATSTAVNIKVNIPQGPYNGIVHSIPGTIQAEEFDSGGNGIAYNDDSPGSSVTPAISFRTDEDVDLETCTDAGGGYNLGLATSGEWLEYTVNVASSGNYNLNLRVACNGDGRTVNLSMDGSPIAGNIAIPNTTGWQTWTNKTMNNIPLTAGQHVLRLTIGTSSYVNINYLTFSSIITGLEEKSVESSLQLFPNPSLDGYFYLGLTAQWQVYNAMGELILQGNDNKVNLSDYASGVYFLETKYGKFKLLRQ